MEDTEVNRPGVIQTIIQEAAITVKVIMVRVTHLIAEDKVTNLEVRAIGLGDRDTSLEGKDTSLVGKATSLEGKATSLVGMAISQGDKVDTQVIKVQVVGVINLTILLTKPAVDINHQAISLQTEVVINPQIGVVISHLMLVAINHQTLVEDPSGVVMATGIRARATVLDNINNSTAVILTHSQIIERNCFSF